MFLTGTGRRIEYMLQDLKKIKIEVDTQFIKIERLHRQIDTLKDEIILRYKELKEKELDIEDICAQKSIGFPWLEEKLAEYEEYFDLRIARYLKNKKHPAETAADNVKKIAKENRFLKSQLKIAKNFVTYYESLFPWLTDYVGENLDDLLIQVTKEKDEPSEDPVKRFVTTSEYNRLSTLERNQMALDRYWKSRKDNWMIGRDYERYVGFIFESSGHKVYYQGILEGREDLGRDLICIKNNIVHIIQCKYWSKEKTIHENHVNQLFGTTVKYILDKYSIKDKSEVFRIISSGQVIAELITSTTLSDTARKFATSLGIKYSENKDMDFSYPCIKCNISRTTNEKIYHLPFDQQYDKTIVELDRNEKYLRTVYEAEMQGFRRAWRWFGQNNGY